MLRCMVFGVLFLGWTAPGTDLKNGRRSRGCCPPPATELDAAYRAGSRGANPLRQGRYSALAAFCKQAAAYSLRLALPVFMLAHHLKPQHAAVERSGVAACGGTGCKPCIEAKRSLSGIGCNRPVPHFFRQAAAACLWIPALQKAYPPGLHIPQNAPPGKQQLCSNSGPAGKPKACVPALVGLRAWLGCANGAERSAALCWEWFDAGGHSIKQLILPLDIVKKSLML